MTDEELKEIESYVSYVDDIRIKYGLHERGTMTDVYVCRLIEEVKKLKRELDEFRKTRNQNKMAKGHLVALPPPRTGCVPRLFSDPYAMWVDVSL